MVGRIRAKGGPLPVLLKRGRLYDLSAFAPTISEVLNRLPVGSEPPAGRDLGPLTDHDLRPRWSGGEEMPLLSPIDLQCIKAAGVTFAVSALERVIEERARGDATLAARIRGDIRERLGADLGSVKPGSPEAAELKAFLVEKGYWSQYLEVAIGPHAEVFTKAPVLSSVGWGDYVGVRRDSEWNNPEPEVVIVCDRNGVIRGATLGNDVNLRDIEGKSALLLGKAKDNNAACALGPFIRLFDHNFGLADLRRAEVSVRVEGEDDFLMEGASNMSLISRDPTALAAQAFGPDHQYPDGFVMFLGTMFAPIDDRGAAGAGFTHRMGDVVRISSPELGVLENKVVHCDEAPPWDFGIFQLMQSLAERGLLKPNAAAAGAD
jgi:fumarylacetoacetate (FAA) hydrolase family protein